MQCPRASPCTDPFSPLLDSFSVDFVMRLPDVRDGLQGRRDYDENVRVQHVVDSVVYVLQRAKKAEGYAPPRKLITVDALKKAFLCYHSNSTRYNLASPDEQQLMRRQFELLQIFKKALMYDPSSQDN